MEELSKQALLIALVLYSTLPLLIFACLSRTNFLKNTPHYTSPIFSFPIAYALIYGFGIIDLTSIEQHIPASQFSIHFFCLTFYYLGAITASLIFRLTKKETHRFASHIREHEKLQALYAVFIVCIVATLASFAKAGVPVLSPDFNNARTELVNKAGGWLYYIYRTLGFTATLALCFYLYDNRSRYKTQLLLIILISLTLLLAGGYRGHVLTPVLVTAIAYYGMYKKAKAPKLIAITIACIILFGTFGAFRTGGESTLDRLALELQTPAMAVEHIRGSFSEDYGYLPPTILLSPFLSILPDSITGEQLAYSIILKTVLNMNFDGGGFTPSLVGSFFMVGGLYASAVGLFGIGLLNMWAYKFALSRKDFYAQIMYAYILVYSLNCIRGGFFQEIYPLWFCILILAFRYRYLKNYTNNHKATP